MKLIFLIIVILLSFTIGRASAIGNGADINRDGRVDALDLSKLLSQWSK